MLARYKVLAAILLVITVSVLLFDLQFGTGTSNQQQYFHRYFLSHRTVLVRPPDKKLYAYVLYATTEDYLCNSVINAYRLNTLNVRETADIVVLYNNAWDNGTTAGVDIKFKKLKALQVTGSADTSKLSSVLCVTWHLCLLNGHSNCTILPKTYTGSVR